MNWSDRSQFIALLKLCYFCYCCADISVYAHPNEDVIKRRRVLYGSKGLNYDKF